MPSTSSDDTDVQDVPTTGPQVTADQVVTAGPGAGDGRTVEAAAPVEPAFDGTPDPVAAVAVELARRAAEEIAESGTVGDHLGVEAEAPGVVTHAFACLAKGYRGWYWAITVVVVPGSPGPTVSDTVLLPGSDAIRSPVWLPWSDRLAPGDLRSTDVLPHRVDDPFLDEGYTASGEDDDVDEVALWELGLGRARVLNALGRAAATERWYRGDRGPTAEEAIHAAAPCSTCGYFLPMAGALRQVFGVCANEWSSSDGRVVSVDHGCGAHSETDVEPVEPVPLPAPILDETGAESVVIVRRHAAEDEAEPDVEVVGEAEPVAEVVVGAEPVAEVVGEVEPAVEVVGEVEPAVEVVAEAEPVGQVEAASDLGPEAAGAGS